jgi:hypothetical protein
MEMQTPPPPPKNSQNPKMSTEDILAKAVGGKMDHQQLHNALAQAVESNPQLRIMRANNTLFIYLNRGNGGADVTMETADNPRQLVDSIKQFIQGMKVANFKQLKFDIDNPDIVRVIKMAGFEPKLAGVKGQKMTGLVEV